MKNLNTISVIESKAYQIQLANQDDQRQQQILNDGEIWIDYKFEIHPIELKQDFVNVQKLRQLEFYYYKIRCQGEAVPLTFTMNQSEQTKFKVFLSTTNPFPSKFSCEQIYQVKTWKYKSKDYKQFRQKFIFISLVCDLDTTIKISFTFGSTQGTQTIYKSPISKQQIKQNLINCDLTASQIIKKKNKCLNYLREGTQSKRISQMQQSKMMNALSPKNNYTKPSNKRNFMMLLRRKQLEINTQEMDQNRYLKSEIQFEMFRLIAYLQLINIIYERLKHQHKIIHHVQIIQIKMKTIYFRAKRNMCRLKGNTIFGRVHLDVKFCLSMIANQIKRKSAFKILIKFNPFQLKDHYYGILKKNSPNFQEFTNYQGGYIQLCLKIQSVQTIFEVYI